MSSSDQITPNPQNIEKNDLIDDLSSHKFNLFQQFFVIGLDPSICYNLYKIDIQHLPPELSAPKVISKYPNTSLPYINIPDSFVASHCFPIGLLNKLIYYNDEELDTKLKMKEEFSFFLDNLAAQDYTSSLRTDKVYYNCLLFYEKLDNFKKLSNYRRKISFKSQEILEEEKNKNILIPKVICLSTFKPLYMSGDEILALIKKYCSTFNLDAMSRPNRVNIYPIENIIEGIIYNIPGLPCRGNFTIRLDYAAFFNSKSIAKANRNLSITTKNINNQKLEVIFDESPINKNPKPLINYSLLFTFFTIEEFFDIIKSVILEEPILFFSEDISNLTHTIEAFLALIYPLKYQYPVVSVLPEENFSLISVFYHFIFGINYKYSEELWESKFKNIGDKSKIVIIKIEQRFMNILEDVDKEKTKYPVIIQKVQNPDKPIVRLAKLEIYKNKPKKENVEKKNVKLPFHYSSKCIKKIEKLKASIQKTKDEEKNKIDEEALNEQCDKIFNENLIDHLLYFFTCILLNYQEYIRIKYEKINVSNQIKGNTEIYKRPDGIEKKFLNNELNINDMFNIYSFINNAPSLDRNFYEQFFRTKIFFHFIKRKIFPMSIVDKLEVLFFDEKINQKLAREIKFKKIETKFLSEDMTDAIFGEINIESLKQEISDETKEFLCNEYNCDKGLNYFQYIVKQPLEKGDEKNPEKISSDTPKEIKLPNFRFYYFVFPKLLNDGIFYKKRKKGINERTKNKIFNSNHFYNILEKEGIKIIDNSMVFANYKNYNYALNPVSYNIPNNIKYKKAINQLWLQLLSKTFYSIPNNKKMYYFSKIIKFLKENIKTIDEESLYLICNIINKYGDQNMNKELFHQIARRKKTYTAFLFLMDKIKEKNNFIDYRSCAEKNIKLEEKFLFIINSFCTDIDKDEKNQNIFNICGKQTNIKIELMYNEKDKYISFECGKDLNDISTPGFYEKEVDSMFDEKDKFISFEYNKESDKTSKKQNLIVTCFYEKEAGSRYQINFKLISPSYILNENWFKNVDKIDRNSLKKENLESYLSAIFYFHQQGLIFDFLTTDEKPKRELYIENCPNVIDLNTKKINIEKKEEQKESEIKIEKKEDLKNNIIMSANAGLDLGGLDIDLYEPSPEIESKTESPSKKKVKNTVTVAEFKLNIDETK